MRVITPHLILLLDNILVWFNVVVLCLSSYFAITWVFLPILKVNCIVWREKERLIEIHVRLSLNLRRISLIYV